MDRLQKILIVHRNLLVIDGKRNITNEGVHLVEEHHKREQAATDAYIAKLNAEDDRRWAEEDKLVDKS